MKYAPNSTLRKRHPRGTRVPLATTVSYIKEIAPALQYAHFRKHIHRDVKPENILLGPNDKIWLSDFGIAALAHNTSSLNTQGYAGTAIYSAPEQIQGKPRPASDQYSLGIIVYEWLTGVPPFSGDITAVIYQHLSTPPPPLREKVPSIPPEVEDVVLKALIKDPAQRFKSIQDFADALEACQSKSGTLLLAYQGHSREVTSVEWSPDGKRIASASCDGTVQVWEATTGQRSFMWNGPEVYVGGYANPRVVAWDPDGKRIAVGTNGAGVEVYDTDTGKKLSRYDRHYSVYSGTWVKGMAWSPDGKYIASGIEDDWSRSEGRMTIHGFNSVDVWEVATQHKLTTCHWSSSDLHAIKIAWSLNGRQISIVAGNEYRKPEVTVCDATTGQKVLSYRGPSSAALTEANDVAWPPDKTRIASVGDSSVFIWNAATGKTLLVHHGAPDEAVMSVAWSPNGVFIASGGTDSVVQVWEATTGQISTTYTGHTASITTLAWSPDGKYIASGSEDNTIQVWQAI